MIIHPTTGLAVGDSALVPLKADSLPSAEALREALSAMILSASGMRKVFAAHRAGEDYAAWADPAPAADDSLSERVSPADLVLAGAAAMAFGDFLRKRAASGSPALLVGIDSRPTGPAIADAMIRVFLGLGLSPRYLFIVAAPEIMAYSRYASSLPPGHEERAEGFCYVSASHNPPAHNGFKFGLSGGVLGGEEAKDLIEGFRSLAADGAIAARILELMRKAGERDVARAFVECSAWKRRALSAYTLFAREVVTGREEGEAQESLLAAMAESAKERGVGVLAELNGSARSLSIDENFLTGAGAAYVALNDRPRAFAHRIVPEGPSLDLCRRKLEIAHEEDGSYALGYVPDCDGDRGNLVWYDEEAGRARVLEAQEVFALCCLAELAQLVREGALAPPSPGRAPDAAGSAAVRKIAVAVNDATSMRIEALARVFGAEVFRAETGEANVVGLAASLRGKGYVVRILGEGSNGGNITHPSAVRDPLATLGAVLKLLLLRESSPPDERAAEDGGERPSEAEPAAGERAPNDAARDEAARDEAAREGLFHIWLRLSGRLSGYRPDFAMGDIVASLPSFATTSVFESRAALRVSTADQAELKRRYQAVFLREWEAKKGELASRYGIVSWKALATKGMEEEDASADFAASGRGGLRILLRDAALKPRAFLWMRGSGTEPVFRIMADIEGGLPEDEEYLLAWQTSMLREADSPT